MHGKLLGELGTSFRALVMVCAQLWLLGGCIAPSICEPTNLVGLGYNSRSTSKWPKIEGD